MTGKRRLTIEEDDGTHLMAVYVEVGGLDFDNADLSGLCAIGVNNLKGKSFRGAILYWANLSSSDVGSCDFENADFRGAVLLGTMLVGANLRGAKLGKDMLGGSTRIQGANFSSAQLHGADLQGALYDEYTIFPVGFIPESAGCVYAGSS